jgi:phage FluMu protein Com
MTEIRCEKCNKLLYRASINFETMKPEYKRAYDVEYFTNKIECKCPRCGTMNTKTE